MRLFTSAVAIALLAMAPLAAPLAQSGEGVFGHIALKARKIDSIPKWVAVLARMDNQQPELNSCMNAEKNCNDSAMRRWREVMLEARSLSPLEQMNKINYFFNEYPYITDDRMYGRSDVWATPREFIDTSGDCEDYSIAKYRSLQMLGFREENLRMFVVHDNVRNIAHAVLGVRVGGEEYVLDNLASRPVRADLVFQYKPYYAVNAEYRWVFVKPLKP